MPHKENAKKALRQNEKHRLQNRSQRSSLRSLIKKFAATIASDAPVEEKQRIFRLVTKRLDQSAAKNLMHKNTVSRTKSRLAARLNKALATS